MDSRKYNYGVSKARESLINNPTPSEQLILDYIKFYNLKHIQFQKVIRINPYKSYIADFYNNKTNTIVEIDGGYHNDKDQMKKDDIRNRQIMNKGIAVVRTTNKNILSHNFPPQLGITKKMVKQYRKFH